MNAKELRQAAEHVAFIMEGSPCAQELSKHILATVRDDDDEPADRRWQGEAMMRSSAGFGMCQTVYAIWGQVSKPGVQSRGQFRSLCRGLGVELKEADRAE